MTLEELIETYPEAETYFKNMPEELKTRYTIRKFPPGTIIHQKDYPLDYFGIVCSGDHRVINEFENGNVFMIEKNEAIDFIGEVTILAEKPLTSVSIETLTECVVFMISREDFEMWIAQDIHLLRLVAHKIAYKLYRSSYRCQIILSSYIPVSGLYAEICFHPQYREEGRSYPSENERRNPGRTGHDCKNHQPNHHKTERRRPY